MSLPTVTWNEPYVDKEAAVRLTDTSCAEACP